MAALKFQFDNQNPRSQYSNGFKLDTPLTATFSRNNLTLDTSGAEVARNAPRYEVGHDGTGGVWMPPINDHTFMLDTLSARILATGVDTDGTTPVMVFHDHTHEMIFVFRGPLTNLPILPAAFGNYSNISLTRQTASAAAIAGGAPIIGGGNTTVPLLAVTGWIDKYLRPAAAIVFHGLIVIAGPVYLKNAGNTHDIVGWGFVQVTIGGGTPPALTVAPVWDDLLFSPQQVNLEVPRGDGRHLESG